MMFLKTTIKYIAILTGTFLIIATGYAVNSFSVFMELVAYAIMLSIAIFTAGLLILSVYDFLFRK